MNQKKCSGCKMSKPVDNFYKNKLVLDGHSNYCIECTRENSKRYFQRKNSLDQWWSNWNLLSNIKAIFTSFCNCLYN